MCVLFFVLFFKWQSQKWLMWHNWLDQECMKVLVSLRAGQISALLNYSCIGFGEAWDYGQCSNLGYPSITVKLMQTWCSLWRFTWFKFWEFDDWCTYHAKINENQRHTCRNLKLKTKTTSHTFENCLQKGKVQSITENRECYWFILSNRPKF